MNQLVRMIKLARIKAAVGSGAPASSLTMRSAIAANGPQFTTPNELTGKDVRYLEQLLQSMSKSRARVSDAHRRGRLAVQRRTV